MTTSAWFPCYVNDLLGSLRWQLMTPAQRGAYWQLICWQMQSDNGHLPDDIASLSQLAGMDISQHVCILSAFPVVDIGRRANRRALREWEKRKALSAVRSEIGKKGIAKRWHHQNKGTNKPIPIANPIAATSTSTSIPTVTDTPTPMDIGDPEVAATHRKRNLVMDALASVDGPVAEITKAGWSKVAKALQIIRESTPGVTPDEIAKRALNYRTHFGNAALTSTALASHWPKCSTAQTAAPALKKINPPSHI